MFRYDPQSQSWECDEPGFEVTWAQCSQCQGTGKVTLFTSSEKCDACKGSGHADHLLLTNNTGSEIHASRILIDPGMPAGSAIYIHFY